MRLQLSSKFSGTANVMLTDIDNLASLVSLMKSVSLYHFNVSKSEVIAKLRRGLRPLKLACVVFFDCDFIGSTSSLDPSNFYLA